jgi:hypothetical protein
MGSLVTLVILGIVVLVGWSFFSSEINAYYENTKSIIADTQSSIPKSQPGTPVYDLTIDVKPKVRLTNVAIGVDYILFLNQEGGTIKWSWINPHLQANSLLSFIAPLSLGNIPSDSSYVLDLATNEIIIPTSNAFSTKIKLSYILVDPETNLQKKLPYYDGKEYNIPALVKDYVINEKIVLKDMPKKDYELWIVPEKVGTFTVRFADSAPGEPYKQKISG